MYGSDWPVCNLAKKCQYADVLQLLKEMLKHLNEKDNKAIFQDNAIKFYGLQDVVDLS